MLCETLHLLVRDGSNRRQKYEEVFKPPKNNRIIFEKQAKWLIQVKLSCLSLKNVEWINTISLRLVERFSLIPGLD